MNAPDRFDLLEQADDPFKLIETPDEKMTNAATFQINKEDHTLGNILRVELLKNPHVLFAGYKMPHPLEHHIVIKVQTDENSNPRKALEQAIANLIKELYEMETSFTREVEKFSGPSAGYGSRSVM